MVVTVVAWFVVVVTIEGGGGPVKGLPFRRGVGEDMWWYL